jgi:putative FmdB family regulatory protein
MIYEYRCSDCKKGFEIDLPITSKIEGRKHVNVKCPHCKSANVVKLIPRKVVVTFRGKGFYVTDKNDKN